MAEKSLSTSASIIERKNGEERSAFCGVHVGGGVLILSRFPGTFKSKEKKPRRLDTAHFKLKMDLRYRLGILTAQT